VVYENCKPKQDIDHSKLTKSSNMSQNVTADSLFRQFLQGGAKRRTMATVSQKVAIFHKVVYVAKCLSCSEIFNDNLPVVISHVLQSLRPPGAMDSDVYWAAQI